MTFCRVLSEAAQSTRECAGRPDCRRRAAIVCRAAALPWLALLAALLAGFAHADTVPGLTVESRRDKQQLEHDVNAFVSAAIVPGHDESLLRWDTPMCPMVAGIAREPGEFILLRLSDIARAAHAPLGPPDCKPNLFVIFAHHPDIFLKLLWRRKPGIFDDQHGIAPVKRFIETPRPIRVWYNNETVDADSGAAFGGALAQSMAIGLGNVDYPVFSHPSSLGSRLTRTTVRALRSVIVVIDSEQIGTLNFGQLSDYVGLIGLAQINLDQDFGPAPTILKLFHPGDAVPSMEMTDWDRALLRALYATSHKGVMQLSEIQTHALRQIATSDAPGNAAPAGENR